MELRYKTKKLEKRLTNDKELVKAFGSRAKKIKQRIKELKAAENMKVLLQIPQLRLHPYKGEDAGIWSIDIHANWRILFTIDQEPIPRLADGGVNLLEVTIIKIESIEDPH